MFILKVERKYLGLGKRFPKRVWKKMLIMFDLVLLWLKKQKVSLSKFSSL